MAKLTIEAIEISGYRKGIAAETGIPGDWERRWKGTDRVQAEAIQTLGYDADLSDDDLYGLIGDAAYEGITVIVRPGTLTES